MNEDARALTINDRWNSAFWLSEDLKYYREWIRKEAFSRIGDLYPQVTLSKEQGGAKATVVAWLWIRTMKCPNPAYHCNAPLIHSFELSKKKGAEFFIDVSFDEDEQVFVIKKDISIKR